MEEQRAANDRKTSEMREAVEGTHGGAPTAPLLDPHRTPGTGEPTPAWDHLRGQAQGAPEARVRDLQAGEALHPQAGGSSLSTRPPTVPSVAGGTPWPEAPIPQTMAQRVKVNPGEKSSPTWDDGPAKTQQNQTQSWGEGPKSSSHGWGSGHGSGSNGSNGSNGGEWREPAEVKKNGSSSHMWEGGNGRGGGGWKDSPRGGGGNGGGWGSKPAPAVGGWGEPQNQHPNGPAPGWGSKPQECPSGPAPGWGSKPQESPSGPAPGWGSKPQESPSGPAPGWGSKPQESPQRPS
ncbi:unnamed protein product, partial [Oncorhynchus mykiss]